MPTVDYPSAEEVRRLAKADQGRQTILEFVWNPRPMSEGLHEEREVAEARLEHMIERCYLIHGNLKYIGYLAAPSRTVAVISRNLYRCVTGPLEGWLQKRRASSPPGLLALIPYQKSAADALVFTASVRAAHTPATPCKPLARAIPGESQPAIQTEVVEGVVHQFRGSEVDVILSSRGREEQRTMSADRLRRAGIRHEGQSFEIRVSEFSTECGVQLVTEIARVGDPSRSSSEPVRPAISAGHFKKRG